MTVCEHLWLKHNMLTSLSGFHLFRCCLNTALEDSKTPFCFPWNEEEKKTRLLERCNYQKDHMLKSTNLIYPISQSHGLILN